MAYGIVSSQSAASTSGGIGDVQLAAVADATATAGERSITLTWTDPEDETLAGETYATWEGTLVIRKAGSAPTSRSDGTVVLDSKSRNAYATTGFTDNNLNAGTTYYYALYPYSTASIYSDPEVVHAVPNRLSITIPTFSGTSTFTYAPSTDRQPTLNNPDSDYINVASESTLNAINAGTYNIVVSLKDTTQQQWSDNTNAAKTLTWTINKATPSITFNPTSLSLDNTNPSKTSTVSYDGDGTLSAQTGDSTTATCSLSGTTLTVTGVKNGDVTITVNATEGDNYTSGSGTIAVNVKLIDTVLNNNSWSIISQVAQAGNGDVYWDVGDCKAVTLNGTVGGSNTGTLTLSNQTLYAFILDFNHAMNGTAENNIIFSGFKSALSDGKDVALQGLKMNNTNTNANGWKGCDMRYEALGNGNSKNADAVAANLTSPRSNTLLAAMPADLRNVIRLWTRWVDATGNSSNTEAGIKATVDAITLLAECEIFASRSYANEYEKNHSTRMGYYTANNSTIRYNHSSTDSAVYWWECSPYSNGSNSFCRVDTYGIADLTGATYSNGVSPAWKI